MAKALRVFVVLLFLLCGVALYLEITVFQQREEIKNRNLMYANAILSTARVLGEGADPHIQAKPDLAKLNLDALLTYTNKPSPNMLEQLAYLKTFAQDRFDELKKTYDDLQQTRDKLRQTEEELAATKRDLEAANAKIAELEATLQQKEAEIAEKTAKIAELEGQIAQLNQEIENKKNEITKLNDTVKDQKDKIIMLQEEIASLRPPTAAPDLPTNTRGTVLLHNPDWNFVIIDIGDDAGAQIGAEMLVHRGEQMVGKIKIARVRRNLSIADILHEPGFQPLQEGDHVLSTR